MSDKRTEMAKLQHQAAETVHTGAGEVGKFIRWAIAALLGRRQRRNGDRTFRMAVSWAVSPGPSIRRCCLRFRWLDSSLSGCTVPAASVPIRARTICCCLSGPIPAYSCAWCR